MIMLVSAARHVFTYCSPWLHADQSRYSGLPILHIVLTGTYGYTMQSRSPLPFISERNKGGHSDKAVGFYALDATHSAIYIRASCQQTCCIAVTSIDPYNNRYLSSGVCAPIPVLHH